MIHLETQVVLSISTAARTLKNLELAVGDGHSVHTRRHLR